MITYFVLLGLLLLSGFSFNILKSTLFKELLEETVDEKMAPVKSLKKNTNPVELAYLKEGRKIAFGVALYSLCSYKLATRNSAGLMRFKNFEDTTLPSSPYTHRLAHIIVNKMKSVLIIQLASNPKLIELFDKMLVPFKEDMKSQGLIVNDEIRNKLHFIRFILGVVVLLLVFYSILFSTGFWTLLLVLVAFISVIFVIKYFWTIEHTTTRGKEYFNLCFSSLGKNHSQKGVFYLAKRGRSGFENKELTEFLGEKKIDWDEYFS